MHREQALEIYKKSPVIPHMSTDQGISVRQLHEVGARIIRKNQRKQYSLLSQGQ